MGSNNQETLSLTPVFVGALTGAQADLFAFICMLVGNRQAAEDLLQDTNLMLMRHAGEYDEGRAFLPWAKAFAYNRVRTQIKRESRSPLVFDDALMSTLAEDLAADPEPEAREEQAMLERCLTRLTPTQRELIQARYFRQESVDGLAARLRRTAISVYVQIHRIRRLLASCIEAGLRLEKNGGRP